MKHPTFHWRPWTRIRSVQIQKRQSLSHKAANSSANTSANTTTTNSPVYHAILRVHGPDSKGIVASVSNVLDRYGCAITQSEQWTDTMESMFFQRLQFANHATPFSQALRSDISQSLTKVCQGFNLQYDVNWRQNPRRVAIFVSNYDHCLWELLLRHQAQELDCEIVAVVSNHETLRSVADTFHIPYHCLPISSNNKQAQEERQLALLEDLRVDLVILARYMQVLSPLFLQQFSYDRIINIHHSFLPAFAGTYACYLSTHPSIHAVLCCAMRSSMPPHEEYACLRMSTDLIFDSLKAGRPISKPIDVVSNSLGQRHTT